ncbi:hypothetical protein ACKKBG_A16435 [Auxenochlorella protothecoides x Auxenochlorella symbiontica]
MLGVQAVYNDVSWEKKALVNGMFSSNGILGSLKCGTETLNRDTDRLHPVGREVRPPSCLGTQGWPLVVQHGACMTDRMVTEEGGEVKAPLPALESRGPASPAHSAKESRGDTASDGSEEDTPVYMHATSFAVQQEDETWELPPFLNHVDKPMLEMQANSNVWYQAHILNHSTTELYVLFPATKQTPALRQWIDKRSSRIWRGSLASRAWKYIKSRDGAWAPRGERGESSGGGGAGALMPGPTLTAGTVPQPRRPGAGSSSQARSRLGGARSSGGNTAGGSATQASRERRAAAAADTAASPDAGRQRLKRPRPGPTPRGTRFQDAPPSDSEASAPGLQKEERALEARSAQQDELLLAWFKHHYELLGRAGLLKGAQLKGNAEVGPLPRHVRVSLLHTGKTATSPAIASPPATDEGAGAKKGRVRGVRAELRSLGLWNWQRGGASSSSEGPSDDDGEASDAGSQRENSGKDSALGVAPPAEQARSRPGPARPKGAPGVKSEPRPGAAAGVAAARSERPAADRRERGAKERGVGQAALAVPRPASPLSPRAGSGVARPRPPPKALTVLEEVDIFSTPGDGPPPTQRAPALAATWAPPATPVTPRAPLPTPPGGTGAPADARGGGRMVKNAGSATAPAPRPGASGGPSRKLLLLAAQLQGPGAAAEQAAEPEAGRAQHGAKPASSGSS